MPALAVALFTGGMLFAAPPAIAEEPPADDVLRFDFGLAGGVVEPGFREVTASSLYDAEAGFGFASLEGAIARDRGEAIGNYMQRDWVGGPDLTFLVDLEPGLYDVRVTVGESGQARTDIELEGEVAGSLSARAGAVSEIYPGIAVEDGQLNVRTTGNPGRINGLEIWPTLVAPRDVAVDAVTIDGDIAHVELSWREVARAAKYEIFRNDGAANQSLGTSVQTSFVDTTATAGLEYAYTVRAIDGTGATSDPSAELLVSTVDHTVAAPAAPTNVVLTDIGRNNVHLAWDAVPGAREYTVYRSDRAHPEVVVARTAEPVFSDTDVLTTVEFTYRVTATNAGGTSESSQPLVTEAVTTLVRTAERLDRGVVAVRAGENEALVTWRLLGLDPQGIGFILERSADGSAFSPVHEGTLTEGTNFLDTTIDFSVSNTYRVRSVADGQPQAPSAAFTLSAGHAIEPAVRVPLREGGPIKFVWVGDLNGDGRYDYVLDRQTAPQSVEAYLNDGTFLWSLDLGHNSLDQNNIEGGSSTIDVGHNDGVTVHDLDSDGKAEVAIRISNGVTFGDGEVFAEHADDLGQSIAILDGMTGALRAHTSVPADYITDGPMYARFGVGHLDGENPSLVAYMKNRVGTSGGSGYGFNLMFLAFSFDGETLTQDWKFLRGDQDLPDGHNTRIVDVDGDGRDEIAEIGFVLNGDGTLKYSLATQDIIHGDRFYIADIDPARPGLEGYGIQQIHHEGLLDYYYDAATGEVLWKHFSNEPDADAGRGFVADIDPRFPGMESWSIDGEVNYAESTGAGLFNAATNQLIEPDTSLQPWPHMGIWWDGDPLRELLGNDPVPTARDARIVKWDWENPTDRQSVPRVLTFADFGATTALGNSVYPTLIADVLGDWREEVLLPSTEFDELIVFTTDQPTDIRLYTLAHNPAYRNGMSLKGYLQSSNVDYFLGHDMVNPEQPNIRYAGEEPVVDTERPTVSLVSPAAAGPFRELQVQVDASDAGGLDKIVANIYRGAELVKSTQSAMGGASTGSHTATVALADGSYTVKFNAHDRAGNVSQTGTAAFTIDGTAPTATVKTGTGFTVQTGETYDVVSFKLHDAGKIDRVEINGVVKNLTDNVWSDVNGLRPGVFGAIVGSNTLVVYDVANNTQAYEFSLN